MPVPAAPVPVAFLAVTAIAYVVPGTILAMLHESAPVVAQVSPPGFSVAVYPVIADPPVFVGATQETWADALISPGSIDAVIPVGAAGAV